jgi:large subunit ribosomal protein L24
MVTVGRDHGKIGTVKRVLTKQGRVVVEGLNRVWKHVRPSQRNPQGGRIQKEAPVQLSNVMLMDPATGRPTRTRIDVRDGQKHRIAVKTGTDLGRVGKR